MLFAVVLVVAVLVVMAAAAAAASGDDCNASASERCAHELRGCLQRASGNDEQCACFAVALTCLDAARCYDDQRGVRRACTTQQCPCARESILFVSSDGDDAKQPPDAVCRRRSMPCATLRRALEAAEPRGDTIALSSGIFDVAGNISKAVTLRASPPPGVGGRSVVLRLPFGVHVPRGGDGLQPPVNFVGLGFTSNFNRDGSSGPAHIYASRAYFTDCLFTTTRSARAGGLLHVDGGSDVGLAQSEATRGHSDVGGGFAYVSGGSTLALTDTAVSDCDAPSGGAVYVAGGSSRSVLTLSNSTLSACNATMASGGGVYADGAAAVMLSRASIVSGNRAAGRAGGGGVYALSRAGNARVVVDVRDGAIVFRNKPDDVREVEQMRRVQT